MSAIGLRRESAVRHTRSRQHDVLFYTAELGSVSLVSAPTKVVGIGIASHRILGRISYKT